MKLVERPRMSLREGFGVRRCRVRVLAIGLGSRQSVFPALPGNRWMRPSLFRSIFH